MKFNLILIAILFFSQVDAQECNYRENQKDEFTGDHLKKTEWQTLFSHTGLLKNVALNLSLVEINEQEYVEILYQLKLDKSMSLGLSKKASKLMFKLDNGKAVALDYGENDYSIYADRKFKSNKGKTSWYYNLSCKFILTPEQKEGLSNNKIEKVRIVTRDNENIEFDIPEKAKAPLLGFSFKGIKAKKFAPQSYFINTLACL